MRWLLCCCWSLLLVAPLAGQQHAWKPDGFGEYVEAKREVWDVPGVAVAVVSANEVLFNQGFGTLHVDRSEPVNSDTRFAIASNTKAFCAATLALLVERGQLSWDDRVQQYLPDFQLYDSYVSADLRIRDLLCHRSGLGTFSGDLLWYGTSFTPEQLVGKVRHLRQAGPYREHYGYSNLMFIAAGEVVRRVTGLSWAEFARREFIEPLGMERTIFSVSDLAGDANAATPHKTLPDQNVPLAWCNWDSMVAAGGIISSSSDMSKWLQLQLRRGALSAETRLYSEQSAEKMWSPLTVIPVTARNRELHRSNHFRGYGLGWAMMDYRGVKILSHGGGYDGMYSCVMLVPEADLGVVVLTNSMTSFPTALAYQVVEQALAANSELDFVDAYHPRFLKEREEFYARIRDVTSVKVPQTATTHPLQDYCGEYRDPKYGTAEVSLEAGKLVLRLLPNPELVADLTHLQYDTFRLDWRNEHAWFEEGAIQFQLAISGEVEALKLNVPNEDLWFDELDLRRVKPAAK